MKSIVYHRKVNFYETDAQGIVHHSNYPRYFEEARGYWLEKNGYPYHIVRQNLNVDIVLLELNVIYKKPLFFGDSFKIDTTIIPVNRFYFLFEYLMYKEGTLICTGKTKHCCIDKEEKKLISIPQELLKVIK